MTRNCTVYANKTYGYIDVYALTVCTPLHGGNKEIYLSIYLFQIMYTSIVTIYESVNICLYARQNCTVYVNKIIYNY